jgi:hypothetical protein
MYVWFQLYLWIGDGYFNPYSGGCVLSHGFMEFENFEGICFPAEWVACFLNSQSTLLSALDLALTVWRANN